MSAPSALQLLDPGPQELGRIAELLTGVCATTLTAHWLYPSDAVRKARLPELFAHLVNDTAKHGTIRAAYQAHHLLGAALWVRCPFPDVTVQVPAEADRKDSRLRVLSQVLGARHPAEPHEHLRYLGVLPGQQGRRIATRLLADRAHRPTVPSYLVAADRRLQNLFHRHGYQPQGAPIVLPVPGGPRLQPMRLPHPPAVRRPPTGHSPLTHGNQ